jgi:hypothetical protein
VPDARQQFVADVRAYNAAGERLVAVLAQFTAMNAEALEDLDAGMSVAESFERRESAVWSRRVSTLLEEFEASRRATRASAAAVLLTEGRTVSDVGKAFGVSHQLASRFARGARAPDGGEGDGTTEDDENAGDADPGEGPRATLPSR